MRRKQNHNAAAISIGLTLALFGLIGGGGAWLASGEGFGFAEPTLDSTNMQTVWASLKEIKSGLNEAEQDDLDRRLAIRTLPVMMRAAFKGDKHPDISAALRPLHGKTGREILDAN